MPDIASDPAADLGPLPEWDLTDLYGATDAPELVRDMDAAAAAAETFAAAHQGKVSALDGQGLGEAIREYERIQDALGRVASYAHLVHAGHMDDASVSQFFQNTTERVNDITA